MNELINRLPESCTKGNRCGVVRGQERDIVKGEQKAKIVCQRV